MPKCCQCDNESVIEMDKWHFCKAHFENVLRTLDEYNKKKGK